MPRPTGRAAEAADRPHLQAREYDVPRFGPARWVPGRHRLHDRGAARGRAEGMDIVRYDAATGARSVLVPARALMPAGAKGPRRSTTTPGRRTASAC